MKFISVIGPKDQLDTVTRQYLCRYEIQLENAMGELKHLNNITPNAELNPYREAAGRAAEIAALYGSKATAVRDMDVDTAMERITEVQSRIQKADRETDALEKELKKERGLLDAVSPYQELHFDISRILFGAFISFRRQKPKRWMRFMLLSILNGFIWRMPTRVPLMRPAGN